MANLLPTKERRALGREHHIRLVVCALIGILVTLLIGAALSTPSLVGARARERAAENQLDALTKLIELKTGTSGLATVGETNARLDILASALAGISAHDLLTDVVSRMPAGVSVWHYAYERTDGTMNVTLQGRATTRDELLAFGDALRQSGLFTSVDVPVSALARSQNVGFTLSLTLTSSQVAN